MIGIGKIWKISRNAEPEVLSSTISRDVISRKPVRFEPLAVPGDIKPSETRAARRFVPLKTTTVLTTKSGKRLAARIINMSRTGIAVEPETVGLLASDVAQVGTHTVAAGRQLAHGIVLIFQTALKDQDCGPHTVL